MLPIKVMRGSASANVTLLGSTVDTNTGNATVAVTPAVGQLLAVFLTFSGSNIAAAGAVTDDQGGTYSQIGLVGALGWFVRDSLVASAVLHTITGTPQAVSSGRAIVALAITGVTKVGSAAVYADDATTPFGAGANPTSTMGIIPANSPVISGLYNATDPSGVTVPSGFTSHVESGYSGPTTGIAVASKNGNETSGTITWGVSATIGNIASFAVDVSP
jgi:hypothetical protein